MIQRIQKEILERFREFIRERYGTAVEISARRPPKVEMGDLAVSACFELARKLKRPAQEVAREVVQSIGPLPGVVRAEVAGAGFINLRLDRGLFFKQARSTFDLPLGKAAATARKIVVEHTNINPNKAAHIGHLRNAALGDTLVRLLRYAGANVEVQNYIDNTGVQVADAVVGFLYLEKIGRVEIRRMISEPRFDYYCWDLYARVTQFYEADPGRTELRYRTLQEIETGEGEAAEIAELVSTAIVRCHLQTMLRMGVEYDLLPRESEILHLKFWDAAFQVLKQKGAIRLAESGKNKGCWVMELPEGAGKPASNEAGKPERADRKDRSAEEWEEEEAKVIVRSNGTVTYVGKDIAYQLWKFGLLGKDFGYRKFHTYPDSHILWMTAADGADQQPPAFGKASEVYNVIDARQSYLQAIVVAGLRALGYDEQAQRSIHFAYEMVALSPQCCAELGMELSEEDRKRPYVEVSGRRGLGVKADDLMDGLIARARQEVDQRHPHLSEEARAKTAHQIAIGALRYFLLRFTRNTVIAFDFKEAMNFEGETGPYAQYATVRAQNIFRKWRETSPDSDLEKFMASLSASEAGKLLDAADDLWDLALLGSELGSTVEAAIAAQEPAILAKYAFQVAQRFNFFYHRHYILGEKDKQKQALLLSITDLVLKQLTTALDLMGISVPERM